MDKVKIEIALTSALSLLRNEINNIEFEELRNEYLIVIENLEMALNELENNG
ncbi:hypothetical protein [Epilithonimonas sp.]|uniref:hypothetical protein n=1 Tax=Epilithonimonas sp. TaxID=2894511 RepID=UPI002FDE7EB6